MQLCVRSKALGAGGAPLCAPTLLLGADNNEDERAAGPSRAAHQQRHTGRAGAVRQACRARSACPWLGRERVPETGVATICVIGRERRLPLRAGRLRHCRRAPSSGAAANFRLASAATPVARRPLAHQSSSSFQCIKIKGARAIISAALGQLAVLLQGCCFHLWAAYHFAAAHPKAQVTVRIQAPRREACRRELLLSGIKSI